MPTQDAPATGAWRERVGRIVKFGVVGVSGTVVNLAVFNAMAAVAKAPFVVANACGIGVSVLTNFLLNDSWTWGDRAKGGRRHWLGRLGKYYVSASAAILVQLVVAWVIRHAVVTHVMVDVPGWMGLERETVDMGPNLAVMGGIVVGMAINFVASHFWAFRDVDVEVE